MNTNFDKRLCKLESGHVISNVRDLIVWGESGCDPNVKWDETFKKQIAKIEARSDR